MTQKSEHEALINALAKMDARHLELGDEIRTYITDNSAKLDEIEVRGRAIVSHDETLNTMGAAQVEIQRQMNDLRAAIEGLELAKRDGGGEKSDPRNLSVAKCFIASTTYQAFAEDAELRQGVPQFDVGSIWQRERRASLATRAANLDFDSVTNPDLVKPDFRDEIVLFPKNKPILRELSTVQTTDSKTVQVDREQVEYAWIGCATASAIATATALALNTVTGLGTAAPYNVIVVQNAGGPETLTISAIDLATKIVTFAPALSNAVAVDDLVSSDLYLCTPEGTNKPQSLDVTEAIDYPVCKLASFEKASDEILTDSSRARQLIDTRLLSRQARMEDKAGFYGPGGATQILGIFNDTDVPTFDFSVALPTGTTRLDHIIDVYYEGIKQNYLFNATILHPDDHKLVARSKDDEGAYIFPMAPMDGAPMRVFSMALMWSNQLERDPTDIGGDFVMGDFEMGITFFDRQNDTIDIGFVHDDFTRNLRTIRIERRFAMAILHPLALAKGTFVSVPAA